MVFMKQMLEVSGSWGILLLAHRVLILDVYAHRRHICEISFCSPVALNFCILLALHLPARSVCMHRACSFLVIEPSHLQHECKKCKPTACWQSLRACLDYTACVLTDLPLA